MQGESLVEGAEGCVVIGRAVIGVGSKSCWGQGLGFLLRNHLREVSGDGGKQGKKRGMGIG